MKDHRLIVAVDERLTCLSLAQRRANELLDSAEKGITNVDAVTAAIDEVDELVQLELAATSASNAPPRAKLLDAVQRRKVENVLSEVGAMRTSLKRIQVRLQRQAEAQKQREDLLRSYQASRDRRDAADAADGATNAAAHGHLSQESQGLLHSRREVQRLAAENIAVLEALKAQRARLSGTGSKLDGVLQSLGLSDQAVQQIKRRVTTDSVIVGFGVFALVLLMIYLWFF